MFTGARRQPMVFAITTAGYDRESICWEVRDYSTKVLQGILEDDSRFGYTTLDDGDDWRDEQTWRRCNPNLGISVKLDDMRELAREARESPAAQNTFRRLRLDEWTEQAERAIDMDDWRACGEHRVEPERLRSRSCVAGLDLSLVVGRKLAHGNHPVLRWMASNLAVIQDPAGNLKPAKNKSKDRIDGIVALIMAMARSIVQPKEGESVYERRGILTVDLSW